MNKYSVRITNAHFTSATITVYADTKPAAELEALYGRTQFKVQWAKLLKRDVEKPVRRWKSLA
jgi:hypothetical protein